MREKKEERDVEYIRVKEGMKGKAKEGREKGALWNSSSAESSPLSKTSKVSSSLDARGDL